MGITIFLNGEKQEIPDSMVISEFLAIKKIRPEVVTVELNDNIIEKPKYE